MFIQSTTVSLCVSIFSLYLASQLSDKVSLPVEAGTILSCIVVSWLIPIQVMLDDWTLSVPARYLV